MALDPRTVAPLVSLAAAWAVRRSLSKAYEKKTGNEPPQKADVATPLRTVILWAAVTALSTAVIDVVVQRTAAKWAIAEQDKAAMTS
jgi:hypothetical protein